MNRTDKKWLCGIMVLVLGMTGFSWAQPGGGGGRGGRPNFNDPNWRQQMRQRMADRMRQRLGVTEEQWKVIGPLFNKVADLQRSSRGRFFGGRRGRGNRGPNGAQNNNVDQSPVQKIQQALSDLLQNDNATPEQIKTQLAALRKARDEARQKLAKAQENLRKVLNLKQEAQLVLMGTLD